MTNLNDDSLNSELVPSMFDGWMRKFYSYVDNIAPASKKLYFFSWLAIAIVLTVASSIFLGAEWAWVNGLVGAPAGIIIWLLCCAVLHSKATSLPESSIWRMRETRSHRQRMMPALVLSAVVIVIMVISGSWLFVHAMGVGGVIVIVASLTVFSMLHRTPLEAYYFVKGLPDPRDTLGDDEEYFEEEDAYSESDLSENYELDDYEDEGNR